MIFSYHGTLPGIVISIHAASSLFFFASSSKESSSSFTCFGPDLKIVDRFACVSAPVFIDSLKSVEKLREDALSSEEGYPDFFDVLDVLYRRYLAVNLIFQFADIQCATLFGHCFSDFTDHLFKPCGVVDSHFRQ